MGMITEEHYNPIAMATPGTYTLTKESMGSRYLCICMRTQCDVTNPEDLAIAHDLQDQLCLASQLSVHMCPPTCGTWTRCSPCALTTRSLPSKRASHQRCCLARKATCLSTSTTAVRHTAGAASLLTKRCTLCMCPQVMLHRRSLSKMFQSTPFGPSPFTIRTGIPRATFTTSTAPLQRPTRTVLRSFTSVVTPTLLTTWMSSRAG